MSPADTRRPLPCNRTACDETAHPCGYNAVTQSLYCLPCARFIAERGTPGMFPLLRHAIEITDNPGAHYVTGTILVKPTTSTLIAGTVGTVNM